MKERYTLQTEDAIKILKAFGWAMASAALAFSIMVVEQVDFAEWAFLVPVINTVLYTLAKFVEKRADG